MSVDRGVPIEEFASVHLPALQTAARDIVDAMLLEHRRPRLP